MFDDAKTVRAAQRVRKALAPLIDFLIASLHTTGVDRGSESAQMASILSKMEPIATEYPAPIVTLSLIFLIDFQSHSLRAAFDRRMGLIDNVCRAVAKFARCITSVLKADGWQRDDTMSQMKSLADKLIASSAGSEALLVYLTEAVTLDKYAKFLVAKTLPPLG